MHTHSLLSSRCTILATAVLVGTAVLAAGPSTAAHTQGLLGQQVHGAFYIPNLSMNYQDLGTQTITSGGATYSTIFENDTVNQNSIVFTFPLRGTFSPNPFDGNEFSEVGPSPVTITGVTIDASSNLAGFNASDVSFDSTDVFANFQGLTVGPGNTVKLDLSFGPSVSATPEPSVVVTGLSMASMTGLGLFRGRKRWQKNGTPAA